MYNAIVTLSNTMKWFLSILSELIKVLQYLFYLSIWSFLLYVYIFPTLSAKLTQTNIDLMINTLASFQVNIAQATQ